MASSRDDIPLNEQLGCRASLTITRNDVAERTIYGLITGAEQGNTDGRRTFYIFTIRPGYQPINGPFGHVITGNSQGCTATQLFIQGNIVT
ncbi:contractile injection system protein, VgrG/Pvc8 family [Photorhabdus sp. P32]|uniref:contractile injection system protein, VgrG/Pvc8 family n=1 Tax=Photorhabdus sp. P32 TaxID=3117549 RepID=UPI00311B009D